MISTDHKPLLGIFKDRDLCSIKNPRIQSLKEDTLAWRFSVTYNPGKWHKGPDAVSRAPSPLLAFFLEQFKQPESEIDSDHSFEAEIFSIGAVNIYSASKALSIADVQTAGQSDETYKMLINTIEAGFPTTRSLTPPSLRDYFEVHERLYTQNGVVYLDHRVVVPSSLRKIILESLHAANQGANSMRMRANSTVYWPGMTSAIKNYRLNCQDCDQHSPSLPAEPMLPSPAPEWPFQQICMDYFEMESNSHSYLITVDRYSGWPSVFHFKPGQATAHKLLSTLRNLFATFGVPEEASSDGSPQFETVHRLSE